MEHRDFYIYLYYIGYKQLKTLDWHEFCEYVTIAVGVETGWCMRRNGDGYLDDDQLKKTVLECIERGRYRLTKHAEEELKNDDLDLNDALHVLRMGGHNQGKTGFDAKHQTWKYAFEGNTKDLKKMRVIIAFVEEMLIITVMEL